MRIPHKPRSPKTASENQIGAKTHRKLAVLNRPFTIIRSLCIRRDGGVSKGRFIRGWSLVFGPSRLDEMTALNNNFVDRPLAAVLGRELASLDASFDPQVIAFFIARC